MKLTVLGCYAPYAPANGACSGYLIQSSSLNVMVDCGHGAFAELQKHIDFRNLDALILTHFHPDHYADIYAVRHAFAGALRNGLRKDPLVVYAPAESQEEFEMISSWKDVFITIPLEDARYRENRLGKLKINFFPVVHPIPTYGVKFHYEGKIFTYTSDTSWHTELIDFCKDSNIILTEASLRDIDIDYAVKGHMTAKQAGLLAQRVQAEKLIITHFWPEYNIYQLKREAEVIFDGQVEPAEMGKKWNLT